MPRVWKKDGKSDEERPFFALAGLWRPYKGNYGGGDPMAYLVDILDRVHDHKINWLDELLLWNWASLPTAMDRQAA